MITVKYNQPGLSKPWEVLDDDLVYDRYATEEEAQSIAATLVGSLVYNIHLH